jgi:hypothetical protein
MKKLCKDCKYYKKYYGYGGSNGIYDECTSPQTIKEKDMVRGVIHRSFCMYERLSHSGCGPDAKYFQQYEPPPVPDKPWWTQNLEKLKNLLG